ncbi:hypothetical protein JYJ95_14430 [Corallococcus exiguus]|uniref:hypothetical protein n=1 Tax=Corallococcus exiguus TaxID=83462 RepID=UPI001A9011F8|nr:hypothetical protein [Corallococcus exiguus]MBN8467713.1 hypothetical protein [Corallococcus exiguus]
MQLALTRKILCCLSLALMSAGCASTGQGAMASPVERPEAPLLAYWPANLWSTRWSSFDQTPDVAIYPSGEVFFKQPTDWGVTPPRLYRILLTQEQQDDLGQRLKALESLKDYYNPAHIKCAPGKVIQWRNERGILQAVELVGGLEPTLEANDRNVRAKAPPAFLAVYDQLVGFNAENTAPFKPERIRLTFAPSREGAVNPVPWPQTWATRVTSATASSENEGFLKAEVSGIHFEDLYAWIQTRNDNGEGVTFNGKVYYILIEDIIAGEVTRTTLPHER